MSVLARFGFALTGLLLVVACGPPALEGSRLTVFAASSLTGVMGDLTDSFGERPWADLTVSTGSSAALRTQIEQGAPADVFLSADVTNPHALVDAGLTEGGISEFASNSLVIVVPEGNPAAIISPADLARDGIKIIAAGDDVPITRYAAEVVNGLSEVPGYPPNFAAAYEANVVSREESVAAVTSKIALGEGDAAIAYASDARGSALTTIELPSDVNVVAEYGGVVLASSGNRAAARDFLAWLVSVNGQVVLETNGFGRPR
ncbi:MAG TPA: molybdate ABC transporter substrate-binding protein [Candidatus Limnocylindrales bacterium]|nr:molybdate ABC transporter substrate-binding protein [Candidatus Limnocylindrales bacterium]